ncbi:hypothetical protein B0H14DRAFT_3568193 [Mycena olivaceomarginata]|nr:hypothetical protein B0H14DRAFT_3568193 [Mycena olivaceomarginata]
MSSARETTHSQCHPEQSVQETRGRKKTGKLSDAEKATRALGAASHKLAQNALAADLDKFASNREDTVADLATKHRKKEEYIRALLMSETRYPETRAPTLRNALIHQLSEEAKQEGITIHLHELQAIADVRLSTEEFSTDEVAALIATLNKHRNHKTRDLRATNTASAVDARSVVDKTQDEMTRLKERTSTDAFGFFSCGALDNPSMPTFVSMGNAAAFCLQVLKMPALDILRLYEQWVIKSNQVKSVPKTLQAIHHQITELMDALLRAFVNDKSAKMVYVHFKVDVALLRKLKIMGWPLDIPFVNPSKIGLIGSLRRIRDDILAGLIHFEALSLLEERALQAEVDAMTAAQGDCLGDNDVERDTHANASTASRAPSGAAGLSAVPDVEHNTRNATAATHAPSGATGLGAIPSRNTTTVARTDAAPISAVGTTAADLSYTPSSFTFIPFNPTADPTATKRKAKQQGGHAAKKVNTASNTGEVPAKPPRKTAGARGGGQGGRARGGAIGASGGRGTGNAGGSGGGIGRRDDATTQAVLARMEACGAAVRSVAALASQMPPSV